MAAQRSRGRDCAVTDAEDFIAHYGVKGMKWGVRKDRGHEGERATTRKIARADKKYEKTWTKGQAWLRVHNAMADELNKELGPLNKKYENKDVDLVTGSGKDNSAYLKDYERLVEKAASRVTESIGTNASGTKEVVVTREGEGLNTYWRTDYRDIKRKDSDLGLDHLVHDDAQKLPELSFKITPRFDRNGRISGQTLELMDEDEIAHYGIKGMKWGVRRSKDVLRRLRTDPNPPSEDSARARNAQRRGINNLSNAELKALNQRLKLEREYSQLSPSASSKGKQFLKDFVDLDRTLGGYATKAAVDAIRKLYGA